MSFRLVYTAALTSFIVALIAVWLLRVPVPERISPAVVNDIVQTLAEHWPHLAGHPLPDHGAADYVVVTVDGSQVAATRRGLDPDLNHALAAGRTVADIANPAHPDRLLGHVIIETDQAASLNEWQFHVRLALTAILVLMAGLFIALSFYAYYAVIRPFHQLEQFAGRIAAGNFEWPLTMDRGNIFGAFTESFDVMRAELLHAREEAQRANRSKKELIAALSHDIRTPVASIQAAAELLLMKTNGAATHQDLEAILQKTEQINLLASNLLHATVDELEQLQVAPVEAASSCIAASLRLADYEKRLAHCSIPDCLIVLDPVRTQQVVDNLISNTYKYAGTAIEVKSWVTEQHLVVCLADQGAGVRSDDLRLVTQKFFRGQRAEQTGGAGLGLYLADSFMKAMHGRLECRNRPSGGFAVDLYFRRADRV
ncbi:MAG: HAMP domain-containing sensor histidine kinase [Sporolactobacillus sp.]